MRMFIIRKRFVLKPSFGYLQKVLLTAAMSIWTLHAQLAQRLHTHGALVIHFITSALASLLTFLI